MSKRSVGLLKSIRFGSGHKVIRGLISLVKKERFFFPIKGLLNLECLDRSFKFIQPCEISRLDI